MKYKKVLLSTVVIVVLGFFGLYTFVKNQEEGSSRFAKAGSTEEWKLSKQNKTVISQQEKGSLDEPVTIDFSLCDKGIDGFSFGFGSTTFNFLGIKDEKCHFYMGTEIENPGWDGYLNRECLVPIDYPKDFRTTNYGADLTFDLKYCTD